MRSQQPNCLWSVGEDGARRIANQRFGHRAEENAIDPLVTVRPDDDEVGFEVAGELRNLELGFARANVNDDPGDRAWKI